jgi:dTDP-L-rhamnose 4-epimerase
MKILITGGAGFIGTHLSRHLLTLGHELTLLDNFLPQVHAGNTALAKDLTSHVRLVVGDIADRGALHSALESAECVVHLAAETGTGQSMYEVSRYERTNLAGTALLYEILAKTPKHNVERVVVASSRAIYGEGAYHCQRDGLVYPISRPSEDKQTGQFDPRCPKCGGPCEMVPTPESAPFQPSSFYGLTKQVQEQTVLMFGKVLRIPSCALRYQNVYGPGQSLTNPYTGILAIFSNLARTGRPIHVFEDGLESRDFVYIDDVVQATAACALGTFGDSHALNVGSGERTTVLEVASQINCFYGGLSSVETTGAFREGDIRHGMADLKLSESLLGYEPIWRFRDGLRRFLEWANDSEPSVAGYEESLTEMKERGLLHARA